jgi:hypothetical protein
MLEGTETCGPTRIWASTADKAITARTAIAFLADIGTLPFKNSVRYFL